MRKISMLVILFIGCLQNCIAQNDAAPLDNKQQMQVDQYVGVQLNGLIRQVFNFNNSTASTVVNPYLVTYNINSRNSGWGIRIGVGYSYNSTATDDGITATTTRINDLQLRLGIEKAFKLSEKWSAGIGIDGVFNTNNDNTTNITKSAASFTAPGDTTTTATKQVGSSYGGGAMGWLSYSITPRVLVGTEASFYYTTGKTKNITDVTSDPNGNGAFSTTETTANPTVSTGTFSSPIVFYISVKF